MQMKSVDSIAFVFSGLYVGGAEKFGITLANKFVADNIPTYIILFEEFNSPMFDQVDKKIEIIYIKRKGKLDFILHKQFENEVEKRKINKIVFFCLSPLFLSRILSFKRSKKIDYFISLHSTIPPSFKERVKNMIFLRFARSKDIVLFICNNQRNYHKQMYFFNPPLFDVIYNGVDTEYFKAGNSSDIADKRKSMGIAAEDKIILLVATLRPEKGHAYAIESLHILHTKYPDRKHAHLVFTGDGAPEYVSGLKQLVTRYSLDGYVHFEGNQKDVRPYLEVADLFTLTSFSVETFSIAALEAMCYGIPISLTNIGGAAEMVIEGKNGNLSESRNPSSMASSWASLLDNGLDKAAIRANTVDNYSIQMIFGKYKNAILTKPNIDL
jgi:glycosyltransferase involved in cell wall biosynthesis